MDTPSGDFAIGDDRTTRHRRDAIPPYRHQSIRTIDGPEAIPAEVHDQPAIARRAVGADAYRRQQHPEAIASMLLEQVRADVATRRANARAYLVAALSQVTTDVGEIARIVDATIAAEIEAGRL